MSLWGRRRNPDETVAEGEEVCVWLTYRNAVGASQFRFVVHVLFRVWVPESPQQGRLANTLMPQQHQRAPPVSNTTAKLPDVRHDALCVAQQLWRQPASSEGFDWDLVGNVP